MTGSKDEKKFDQTVKNLLKTPPKPHDTKPNGEKETDKKP
jgi:hypothetical protein